MMKQLFSTVLFSIFLSSIASSQNNPTIRMFNQVNIEKDSVEIGEAFDIQFKFISKDPSLLTEVNLSSLDSMLTLVSFPPDTSSNEKYADFEISNYGNWPPNNESINPRTFKWTENSNQSILEFNMQGIIWEMGIFAIPPLKAKVSSTAELINSESEILKVGPPEQYIHQDSTSVITDIKTIQEEAINWKEYKKHFIFSALALILLCLILIYLRKRKSKEVEEEEIEIIIRPAHEIALEKLNILQEQKLWEQDEIKKYQSQLTFIIREYLENRYDLKALELTTDEIVKELRSKDFDPKLKANLKEILMIADLVKFAKAKPGLNIHEEFMIKAFEFVNTTKLIPEENSDELDN